MPYAPKVSRTPFDPSRKRHQAPRPSSMDRGYDYAWQKMSIAMRSRWPPCVLCLCRGNFRAAAETVADHIVPHRIAPTLRLEWTNLQTLCRQCHNRDKRRAELAGLLQAVGQRWFTLLCDEIKVSKVNLTIVKDLVPDHIKERLSDAG